MPQPWPTTYGELAYLVQVDASLVPHVVGALRTLQRRSYWETQEDYESAYTVLAEMVAHMTALPLTYEPTTGEVRPYLLRLPEQSQPATPPAGYGVLYADSAGLLRFKNDDGLVQRASYGRAGSFPASFTINVPFFREDLGIWCFWDGSRWLTIEVFTATWNMLSGFANSNEAGFIPELSTYKPYITQFSLSTNVSTTNNATNYWQPSLHGISAPGAAGGLLLSTTTIGQSVGTWYTTTPTVTQPAGSFVPFWRLAVTKVGAPGTLAIAAQLRYRLIIT